MNYWDKNSYKPKPVEKAPKVRHFTMDDMFATLRLVYGEEYCDNPHRIAKAKSLFKLASGAVNDLGFIVELGAHLGYGSICLCFGANDGNGAIVHTVDAFKERDGWAGERYGADNLASFHRNMEAADIMPVLHVDDFVELGKSSDPLLGWDHPVSLLVWDGGTMNSERDIEAWQGHVSVGGMIAIHDTENGVLLSDQLCRSYTKTGKWAHFKKLPGGFRTITRTAR